jgi:hypothetical protein
MLLLWYILGHDQDQTDEEEDEISKSTPYLEIDRIGLSIIAINFEVGWSVTGMQLLITLFY